MQRYLCQNAQNHCEEGTRQTPHDFISAGAANCNKFSIEIPQVFEMALSDKTTWSAKGATVAGFEVRLVVRGCRITAFIHTEIYSSTVPLLSPSGVNY
tara:strand:- start:2966 stop:3259 length:294 start_codon:yes stop_codon:yes gene_type:complete